MNLLYFAENNFGHYHPSDQKSYLGLKSHPPLAKFGQNVFQKLEQK
jgi:hypothetical protein